MVAANTYNESNIQKFENIEAVQARPEQFIGETNNPTHLLIEVIDNAFDEVMANHASMVVISIDTINNSFIIYDNGRGIPLGIHPVYNDYTPIIIASTLFSGGKFNDKAYVKRSGLHGVGLCAVNALSDYFIIRSVRDNSIGNFIFKHGKIDSSKVEQSTESDSQKKGTTISFKPSSKYFVSTDIDINKIVDKVNICKVFIPNIQIILSIDNKIIPLQSSKDQFINFNLKIDTNSSDILFNNNIFITADDINNNNCMDIYFNFNIANNIKRGSVNLLPVDNGTHINIASDIIIDYLLSVKSKSDIYTKKEINKILTYYCILYTTEMKFSEQIKTNLCTRKGHFKDLIDLLNKQISLYFKSNSGVLDTIKKLLNELKIKSDKKDIDLNIDKKLKRGSIKIEKLMDCKSKDCNTTELFIIEGDSAAGNSIKCRNPVNQAILALQGKSILNISSMDIQKDIKRIIKNTAIRDLIESIGIDIKNQKHKFRYNKIILLADVDADGKHIVCLLLILFSKICPELINQGKLFYCLPPLYGFYNKKKFIAVWTEEERLKYISKKVHLTRFKGLAEMNADQLKPTAFDISTRNLIQISFSEQGKNDMLDISNNISLRFELLKKDEEEGD